MIERPDEIHEPLRRADDVARTRDCLRCSKPFDSEWSGERVCRSCKSKHAWRSGMPPGFSYSGRR